MATLSLGVNNDEWLEVRVIQMILTVLYHTLSSGPGTCAILVCHGHFQPEQL